VLVPRKKKRVYLATPPLWREDLAEFESFLRVAGRSAQSVKLRIYHLRRFATDVACAPFQVTQKQIISFLDNQNWSVDTRHNYRSSLAVFYSWAADTDRTEKNVMTKVPQIKTRRGIPRPTSMQELQEALKNADQRTRLMIIFAARLGLRVGEIVQIHTRDLLATPHGYTLIIHGKGNKTRLLPIDDNLANKIRNHHGYIFPGQIDGHISVNTASKHISQLLPTGHSAHSLRHQFATRTLETTGNIRIVQEALGHESLQTTQIYTAINPTHLRDALKQINI